MFISFTLWHQLKKGLSGRKIIQLLHPELVLFIAVYRCGNNINLTFVGVCGRKKANFRLCGSFDSIKTFVMVFVIVVDTFYRFHLDQFKLH